MGAWSLWRDPVDPADSLSVFNFLVFSKVHHKMWKLVHFGMQEKCTLHLFLLGLSTHQGNIIAALVIFGGIFLSCLLETLVLLLLLLLFFIARN